MYIFLAGIGLGLIMFALGYYLGAGKLPQAGMVYEMLSVVTRTIEALGETDEFSSLIGDVKRAIAGGMMRARRDEDFDRFLKDQDIHVGE